MNQEEYNKETERLQQLIDYKTKEAQSAPPYAQKEILDEVERLKLQLQVHADNPPKKEKEPRAQGLLQSVKSAEKASAGITPPVSNTEEVQVDEKNIGVLQPGRYEPKRYAKEKDNRGDNKVAMKYDPSYHDAKSTAEVVEEQKNNVPEEPADKGDFSIGGSAEGKEFIDGPKPETKLKTENSKAENSKAEGKESKGRYKSSMYGILDAMRNGDIDKSTGLYFMLDALSKAARNTGIDIGNIGAQFSGGTVRNDYQDSLWNQRKNRMFENEVTSELNTAEGTDKEMAYSLAKEDLTGKGLSNEQADLALNASRTFNEKAEQFRAAGNDALADLYSLVGSAATREIGPEEIIAIASSPVLGSPEGQQALKELLGAATNIVKAGGDAFGGFGAFVEAATNPEETLKKFGEKVKDGFSSWWNGKK